MNALDRQEGGSHYKRFTIQPIEFTTKSFYDPSAHSLVKYVLRHGDKGGMEDLRKADHFAELRHAIIGESPILRAMIPNFWKQNGRAVSPNYFCAINSLPAVESHAIFALDEWIALGGDSPGAFSEGFLRTRAAINNIARTRYGVML